MIIFLRATAKKITKDKQSWRWRQHSPLKRWYPTTTKHVATTQKSMNYKQTAKKKLKNNLSFILPQYVILSITVFNTLCKSLTFPAKSHYKSNHCYPLFQCINDVWVQHNKILQKFPDIKYLSSTYFYNVHIRKEFSAKYNFIKYIHWQQNKPQYTLLKT